MASVIPALSKIKSKQSQSKPYTNGFPKNERIPSQHPSNHNYTSSNYQPSPLPLPQAKQPPMTPPKPHASSKPTNKSVSSKSKSSNSNKLTIVFYGHRHSQTSVSQTMDGDFISEIRFNKVVYVQSLRICNLQEKPHAQLLPDFIGRTPPQTLNLFVSARDCSNKERSFVPLVQKALKFNVKSDGKKSKRRNVTNQKIPTDHLYIRGKFSDISLIVYGYIDDKLTKMHKSESIGSSVFSANHYDTRFLLDTLNEFEFNGVGDRTEVNDTDTDIINIPKKSNDADGMLFDPSQLCTYSNLRVLRQYDEFFDVNPPDAENMMLMSKVCKQLLDLYPVIKKIQTIERIEKKIGDKANDKRRQFAEQRENVLNLLCSSVSAEIMDAINKENIYKEYKFMIDIVEMCCQQMVQRMDIATYLDFLFVLLKRREIKNAVLLLQYFIDRKAMNGHCILYDLILDESVACITRISVIKLLSVIIESEYGMTAFLRESDVSKILKSTTNKVDDDNDTEMLQKEKQTKTMSGLQILVQLSTSCDNEEIIDAIKPIFQQVTTYCRLNEFCEWNEANSTYLIMPMNDARYWQKSLSLMKMLRHMLDEYLADCIEPDAYEHETRLLFKTARSDPCCLMPKTANLAPWHIGYFKQFKVIPTLNNYLTILETKIEKLQSPKEHIISESCDDDDSNHHHHNKEYTMRHQKIALFTQIKNEIVGILLCLTSSLNGSYILSEYDVDLFGLFCGLNKELKDNKAHRNAMDVDHNNNNNNNNDRSGNDTNKANILSYYGTPRLSELLNDSANNRPIRGKDVCNAICRQLQVLVLIHHMNHSKKESTAQLRALYLLDLLSNYEENMESITFGLYYTNSFASICELIWLAFNPQDRSIITPSGFTGQGIKLLLYLLESQYLTNIALNPLYFEFFQQLLSDFVAMYQSLQTKIILQKQAKKDTIHRMDVDGDAAVNGTGSAAIPSLMETMSMDIQCIVGILQPVVKLREQGFNSILKVFATLIGFEPANVGGDYDFDLEFFHLRFPNKHTIDTENKSILYSLNSILTVFIESASCDAIIELLASESFVNMVPIVLRTFVNFFKSSPISSDDWYFASDGVLLENEQAKHWNERCELMLRLLGNTLHLTYIYLNELYAANAFVYPHKIAAELFDVQRILSSSVWQHDLGNFTRNNRYFTHVVDPLFMSSHSFVDCVREYSSDYMQSPRNPLLQTIYESIAGIFAFTLCPPNHPYKPPTNIDIADDGIDDTLLYPEKYEMEEFLHCLTFEPQLFVSNLLTLHQCLIHVNALGLKQHWIQRLTQQNVQRKLRTCMKSLALSSDFYIHQVLPCVYIQLSQMDINIAKNVLNPFIEMVFSQFLSQQTVSNSIITTKWQLIRLCKCLSWMLRDAWSISLVVPQILSKYINDPLFNHDIDETPINQLLQKINQITLQCQKEVAPQTSPTANNNNNNNINDQHHHHHHRHHHHRSNKHRSSSHRTHSSYSSHSHSRSRSRHNRRKHNKHHKSRSNKNQKEEENENKKEKEEEIVLTKVNRSKYYKDPKCWVLDPRIVRILYLKTDGLLTKLFQYISQTDSGLVVAVTDILQCALTHIPCKMSGFNSTDTLLPSSNDIAVILSHLNTVLQAAQFTSATQTVITEFQWRFWMCCFIIYGRIACLPNINIAIVIEYFPLPLITKILSSSLSFLKSYANTNMSHNFNLHVSEKLQCLIIIMWFISMIAKHVALQNQINKRYVATKQMEWSKLYKTQLNEIVIVLNKLNEIGFNHIINEIEYCQTVFVQNESYKNKADKEREKEDDDDDENNDVNDIDIVLDNDCNIKSKQEKKTQPQQQQKTNVDVNEAQKQQNMLLLSWNHNIKEEILRTQNVNIPQMPIDQLIYNIYYGGGRWNNEDAKNTKSVYFGDNLWYLQMKESIINWWHNNMLSIIRLCSYSTNYDFSVYPPSVYIETVQAIPSMFNAMLPVAAAANNHNVNTQQMNNHRRQQQQIAMESQQQQRINKMKMQQTRVSGTDRFRSNNYTGGRAPSIHVDDFQSDPNMITAHTPTTAGAQLQQQQKQQQHVQQQNHISQQQQAQQQQTTIHVSVPNATAAHPQYAQTILVPSTAAHHHRAHAPRIIQSSAINPMNSMAAALLQRQQIAAAAQQQINQMNQINLIRNAAAQQQQQQQQQQHLLRR